eukprot:TRINITY_DN8597_c0_g1_i1.p2 TRINITY_DN8597_c0_g1~~TRINITY_DN8597_c0_g1_i1.p2  ORF type:complete len:65 (-),score=6.61 TRINITY_DN8597_c0_g1_i1:19-213(-)
MERSFSVPDAVFEMGEKRTYYEVSRNYCGIVPTKTEGVYGSYGLGTKRKLVMADGLPTKQLEKI